MKTPLISLLLLLSFLLSGCSINIPKPWTKPKETLVSSLPPEALILDGQQSYEKTLQLMASAKKSLYIQQTVLSDPRLLQLIMQKASAGIEVRILLDQFMSANRSTLNELKKQNISVQYYPARRGQIFDTKFLIVDQSTALVYSFPWSSDGFASRNLTVLLREKSVWKLTGIFNRDWQFTTTLSLDVPKESSLPEDHILLATNANVKQQLVDRIAGSQSSIRAIVTEVTDQDLVQSLLDAASKGRDVRLLLSPTIMPGNWPETLQRLNAANIQIRYFKDPLASLLALNVGIFDEKAFITTSSGWSYNSFVMDHELSLYIPSPSATRALLDFFDQAWATGTVSAK